MKEDNIKCKKCGYDKFSLVGHVRFDNGSVYEYECAECSEHIVIDNRKSKSKKEVKGSDE